MSDASRSPAIVWFRQDLRLADNPALLAACESGRPVLPVYVLDDETPGDWRPGGASRWWLHHSLADLDRALQNKGARLHLRKGPADRVIRELVEQTGAGAVYWNRCYEPFATERDARLKAALKEAGVEARSFNGSLLAEPWEIATKDGGPYRVFTPFWKALQARGAPPAPAPEPGSIEHYAAHGSDELDAWGLLPTRPDWAGGLRKTWTPGEAGAQTRLEAFIESALDDYSEGRNRPDRESTSRLSPHLHCGEISPRQVWTAVDAAAAPPDANAAAFLSEIGWREFSHHLLHHFPRFPDANFQSKFDAFPWRDGDEAFRAWTRGETGFPIVDAGMRQLWETGWMHNRVRMIVASFLVKDLMIDWRKGEAWFWDTLVDADLANNAAGWQWTAGSGADAAPFFRIFNPITQGRKFDPDGAYVRRWVPELGEMPADLIHAPWEADSVTLAGAGVRPGETYPDPIVDHGEARKRALAAFNALKDAA
ncbi:deoxyribodipyrimidine photolyase [Marinicauda salina]|uniref:Deoxyribodipyrimidine photo-lyase n=1 Tax=Marinicauda salina TaxID=2135793 RepID=A0A2U2BVH8_9PROT|nr:deoxyribodipyrimidine photo-lyase [Marinicauda salina]PWE18025.1 deoxyribodipyrimidine photolyase [Marinicauda salina]